MRRERDPCEQDQPGSPSEPQCPAGVATEHVSCKAQQGNDANGIDDPARECVPDGIEPHSTRELVEKIGHTGAHVVQPQ